MEAQQGGRLGTAALQAHHLAGGALRRCLKLTAQPDGRRWSPRSGRPPSPVVLKTRPATQLTSWTDRSEAQMHGVQRQGAGAPHCRHARCRCLLCPCLVIAALVCCSCSGMGTRSVGQVVARQTSRSHGGGNEGDVEAQAKVSRSAPTRHPALKEAETKQLDILHVHCGCRCCCSVAQQRSAVELGHSDAHAAVVEETCRQTAGCLGGQRAPQGQPA